MSDLDLTHRILKQMSDWKLKLLFDGQCPYCRLEVRWLGRWNRQGHLVFEDISSDFFEADRYGLKHDDLIAVLHGVLPDGQVIRGPEVFRRAYRAVGLGWILAPTGWPLLRPVFDRPAFWSTRTAEDRTPAMLARCIVALRWRADRSKRLPLWFRGPSEGRGGAGAEGSTMSEY